MSMAANQKSSSMTGALDITDTPAASSTTFGSSNSAATPGAQADPSSDTSEYMAFQPRFALGRGQFGVVYLMQHPDGRKAVDKRVPLAGLSEEQRKQTFGEIELLRRLQHEYVVRYFHSWETEEPGEQANGGAPTRTLHILMEYCDDGSLEEAVNDQKTTYGRKPFAQALVRGWLLQLTAALEYVHSQRVIHRDLKTANILLSGGDKSIAKLGDFGISRLMSSQTNFAATAVGTPYYLSPELITSDGMRPLSFAFLAMVLSKVICPCMLLRWLAGYDGRADVWSLGVILYELLTFSRPFHGENIAQLAMAIARRQPKGVHFQRYTGIPCLRPRCQHAVCTSCAASRPASGHTAGLCRADLSLPEER